MQDPPLPNWPILMETALAARYLSLDENSFAEVMQQGGVQPVDLGLSLIRWRRAELDRLVGSLPVSKETFVGGRPLTGRDPTNVLARRVAEEVVRILPLTSQGASEPAADVMGINDAAKAIGVGKSTIYKLISEGRLQTRHIGRRVLIRRADLIALLTARGG